MPSKANLIDYMNKIRHKIFKFCLIDQCSQKPKEKKKKEKKKPVTATVVRILEGMIEVI